MPPLFLLLVLAVRVFDAYALMGEALKLRSVASLAATMAAALRAAFWYREAC